MERGRTGSHLRFCGRGRQQRLIHPNEPHELVDLSARGDVLDFHVFFVGVGEHRSDCRTARCHGGSELVGPRQPRDLLEMEAERALEDLQQVMRLFTNEGVVG